MELGTAPNWRDMSRDETFGDEENHGYGAGTERGPSVPIKDSDECLRDLQSQDHANDIWKSTTVTISRGWPQRPPRILNSQHQRALW